MINSIDPPILDRKVSAKKQKAKGIVMYLYVCMHACVCWCVCVCVLACVHACIYVHLHWNVSTCNGIL